ncbi:MAG: lipoyl domain-containing protein, partial [bacterium]|nr:lipoyl domain-containing protein [bacterium]
MGSEIILPKFGQQTETSTIIRWYKKEGDHVEKGEPLLEIQTDKAAMDVESFAAGTLLKIWAQPGEELPVMSVIGYIGAPGEPIPPRPPLPTTPAPPPPPTTT